VSIIDLLVKLQIIDERQNASVMSRAGSSAGGALVRQVAEMGYATEGAVARAVSVELGLPRIDPQATQAEPAALELLDARTCESHYILPVALRENGELLWLAMADPTDEETIDLVRRKAQKRVRPAVAGPSEILRAAKRAYAELAEAAPKPDAALSPIELHSASEERFEVVNVSEEIGAPLSGIADQLGIQSPGEGISVFAKSRKVLRSIPPKTDPLLAKRRAGDAAYTFEELFAPPQPGGGAQSLAAADLQMVEALRGAMEKGALILRAVAELCVEKGVFTREEMKHRRG
jgi:type IV pilus assembly protein PilB